MSQDSPAPDQDVAPDLLRGGAFYALMHRFGVDPANAARTARRAAGVALLLWVPGALLALLAGHALRGEVALPYFLDVAAYARPLLCVPLLLIAKPILATSWREAGALFRDRGIVGPATRAAGEALAQRVTRAARRSLPTVVFLALALAGAVRLARAVEAQPRDAWFATAAAEGGSRLTPAGFWSAGVVHAALFCLTLAWLWRLLLWYRFLWGISRLPLTLLPTHPDRAAGLAFLGRTIGATAPLVLAWVLALASAAANRMLHDGQALASFAPLGAILLVAVLLLFVVPPTVIFAPLIARRRREALEEWGRRMAQTGEEMRRAEAEGRQAVGRGPSLEDLHIAVLAVRTTLPFPFALSHLVAPLLALALPALALVLLAVPFGELLDRLLGLLS